MPSTMRIITGEDVYVQVYFYRSRLENSHQKTVANYTPRKLCLWEGILFSRCPSVRPTERKSDRASVTFCFLNILKNH